MEKIMNNKVNKLIDKINDLTATIKYNIKRDKKNRKKTCLLIEKRLNLIKLIEKATGKKWSETNE